MQHKAARFFDNFQDLRWYIKCQLKNCDILNYDLDTDLVLAKAFNLDSREKVLFNNTRSLNIHATQAALEMMQKRLKGEPIAYIIEEVEFWKSKFKVNRNVLIPRPETELLMEVALQYFDTNAKIKILELGIGSGALLLSLLQEFQYASGLGVDISKNALSISKHNSAILKLKNRLDIIQSDWFQNINDTNFNLIVSNPPYIKYEEWEKLDSSVMLYEPKEALTDYHDGFAHYRTIAKDAGKFLVKNGILILECGIGQSDFLKDIFSKYNLLGIFKDLQGIERCLVLSR